MNKKICIIDDDQDMRKVVSTVLKTKDYEVLEASDGMQGLKLIESTNPDLLILDLMMPGISGMEVCKRLRDSERFADLPIIVISAITRKFQHDDEYWAAGLKSDEFMGKPFEPYDLLSRVEYLLRRKSYIQHPMARVISSPEVPETDPANDDPEKVVQKFMESWNTGDFGVEYDFLGEEMRFGMNKSDYSARRHYSHSQASNRISHVKYADTLSAQVDTRMATVVCVREETIDGQIKKKKETFILRLTKDGWKIISVRSKPMS